MTGLKVGSVTTLKSNPEKRVVVSEITRFFFFKRYEIRWINDNGSWNSMSGLKRAILHV